MKITEQDIREAEAMTLVAGGVEKICEGDIPRLWDECQKAGGIRYEAMKALLRRRRPELLGRFMGCGFAAASERIGRAEAPNPP
jgi:hypothetical protein